MIRPTLSSSRPARRPLAALALAALVVAPFGQRADGANVLLVTANSGSLTSEETSRRSQFEAWGHTVATIWDNDSQSNFNTAMASADVVYIPVTIQEWELTDKVKLTDKGVVCEERYLDIYMGFSTNLGWHSSYSQTEILDNTHPVTSGLSTGYVTIVSSSSELALMNDTIAGGMTILSKQNLTAGNMLGVIDTGGALAGGGTAAGRRVRLPWGGDSFSWSSLNANGLLIARQAIEWAVGIDNTGLLLHWKLDETSGSTTSDSSEHGRDGTISGSSAWTDGQRDGAIDLAADATAQVSSLLGNPTSFTVSAWANLETADSGGAEILSVGDYIGLRLANNSSAGAIIFFRHSSDWESLSVGANYVGTGWRHFVGVFDDDADSLRLYVDGVLVASKTTTQSLNWSGLGSNTVIGAHGNGGTSYDFDGAIDDVRVYGSALSDAEIAEVHGLLGHWTFDEGAGSTAADSSINANDATFNTGTPAWVSGVRGAALEFDGTNDAVTGATFNPTAEGAVAFWFRSDGPPSARQRPWGLGGDFEMWQDPDGLISCDVSVDGFQGGFITNDPLYEAGRWYHLVAQYDSDDDSFEIYVDGKLHKSGVSTWDITQQTGGLLSFGTRTGSSQRFSGALDDFRVYGHKLNEKEIARLYGLVGHWKLDESSGSTAFDSSGLGNDGVYVSTVDLEQSVPGLAEGPTGARFSGAGVVQISDSNDYNMDQGLAIAAWVYPEGGDDRFNVLAFEELGQYSLAISDDQSPEFTLNLGYPAGYSGTFGGGTDVKVTWGAWRHLVASYDGAEVVYYLNGVEVDRIDASGITLGYEVSDIFLGQCLDTSVAGRLHDVRLYNRPVVPSEARSLYYGSYTPGLRIIRWVETANP